MKPSHFVNQVFTFTILFVLCTHIKANSGTNDESDTSVTASAILKDINDNTLFFPHSTYIGNVTENGTPGMKVMSMTATDQDNPNKESHAKLKYFIEQNQVNELGQHIFSLDEDTGVITTAVCCLDRETNPDFMIKVFAMDGGGLKGTATVTIKLNDMNDMPPEFTKKEWFAEVDETENDHIPKIPIVNLSVLDGDLFETNRFNYTIVNNTFGADKFTMVTNSDGTGSLKVVKPLDYEDFQQRHGFNLTISVSDVGVMLPYHVDYAKVNVRLRDINDNKPEFEKPNIEVSVFEDIGIGTSLATFHATDADQGGQSKVRYMIDRASDIHRQFQIDQDGIVSIQRTLDRENIPRHQIKILAVDDGVPPQTATATLTVVVKDINDNAPRFLKDYRPVIYEYEEPKKVAEILATDDDVHWKGNGAPFYFRMDPNATEMIKTFFEVQHNLVGDNGHGMAIVYSKHKFDRELQKEYLVPIVIKDSGIPAMTGTSTLTVVIGDYNDNRMYSGNKHIIVYTLKGYTESTPIGRVHVEDLDDWDLSDKSFFFRNNVPHPYFDLDKDTGVITMKNITSGFYDLHFNVYDRKHTQEVNANVTVVVKEVSEDVIYNSGSMRLSGITAEEFVEVGNRKHNETETSKYEKMKTFLAHIFETEKDKIEIFSVITKQLRPPITDIRFSAKGSSHYKSVFLDGTVALNRDTILNEVGINITMVGIDECLVEGLHCDGSCTNKLEISRSPVITNANRTAFVGVNAWISPQCTSGTQYLLKIETCQSEHFPCLNGGCCTDSSVGAICSCPQGFDGPRCQQTTRTFRYTKGWAWFPPLQQLEELSSCLLVAIFSAS